MTVTAIKCPSCKQEIFSRARHDYRKCKCGEVAVDGGFDYLRMGFKDVMPTRRRVRVRQTRQQLYDDWNTQADKFGVIKSLTRKQPRGKVTPCKRTKSSSATRAAS